MKLGHLSISIAVENLQKSRAFYEAVGFQKVDGDEDQHWLIMKCGDNKVGLYEGMFDGNMLTFEPQDVRAVQAALKAKGYTLDKEAPDGVGAAHMAVTDPDGNVILFNQN